MRTCEHESNGAIESGIGFLTGHVRTIRDCVETRMGITLDQGSQVSLWLIMWCAFIYNVSYKGPDGRTAYQRLRGKQFKQELMPWGETIHYLPLACEIFNPEVNPDQG